MQIQGRKRRQRLRSTVRGESHSTVRDTCWSGVRDLTARMADELSRVGTRAAAREAKRQLWRLVDYYRALEACCASWIAQTRIDACKLLHVPARVVLSDRTRKDQVESLLHRCLTTRTHGSSFVLFRGPKPRVGHTRAGARRVCAGRAAGGGRHRRGAGRLV